MAPTRDGYWEQEFARWLAPFLDALGRKERRHWAPLYLRGLLAPGERKSIEPLAARVAPGQTQQLHHFVAASPWDVAPVEAVLARTADALVGGPDAVLIVDDTALPKKGTHSVGVAPQYCGALGKRANCQCLVSLTLARDDVPVPVALRLFLPQAWTSDAARCRRAGVPPAAQVAQTKPELALAEVRRLHAAGVRFGAVLADAGYGSSAAFRHGLSALGLTWAVGLSREQRFYPASVGVRAPGPRGRRGGQPKHPVPTAARAAAHAVIAALGPRAFRTIRWRRGTKGWLTAQFAACRVRIADGAATATGAHLPGEEVWLVCERRTTGEQKYYVTNHAPDTPLRQLAAVLKARWSCEQAHQQLKEELGLDHFEGRSWHGLHHHAVLTLVAFAFLQHLRVGEKKAAHAGGPARDHAPGDPPRPAAAPRARAAVPALSRTRAVPSAALNLAE